MPIRSSDHGSPATDSTIPAPRNDAIRMPSGASTRCSSSSQALQLSVRCEKTENAYTRSNLSSGQGSGGCSALTNACRGGGGVAVVPGGVGGGVVQPPDAASLAPRPQSGRPPPA